LEKRRFALIREAPTANSSTTVSPNMEKVAKARVDKKRLLSQREGDPLNGMVMPPKPTPGPTKCLEERSICQKNGVDSDEVME